MTDTEASFAMMDTEDVVRFIKKFKDDVDARYELRCAMQALGYDLLRKYKLLSLAKRLFGGLHRCKCDDCRESGTVFYVWGNV